ncbi:hypothetical protein I6A84_26740 [Frankia sp. CNm7]|uniref:Uncharacterized protein n=1 Tax=Frankia nepalensis TaxID=1836974 RepID=A0A937RAS6_9ACTN|nr:hypothetical protein [Frankia nepalensis]MBL7501315.1 hypothetical protein [Frankia nepalensis]MBL7510835.1 hypothetical protein [Frankia nepalensis]MBL7521579.1 hypothetical protein [Frankia nepalensis]MBL7628611.1 hypothetical protein [Frankia nepalensis]
MTAADDPARRWRRRDDASEAPVLDLTDVDEVTTTLLAPPEEFRGLRRRVVDQFTLLSANRARLARSVNWGPLDGLLAAVVPPTGRVDTRGHLPAEVSVLLPLSTLPKRALVAFDLAGPGGDAAHLVPYPTSVALQGNVVTRLAEEIGLPAAPTVRRVVDAISRFRPGKLSGNHLGLVSPSRRRPLAVGELRTYLEQSADLAVPEPRLRRWAALAAPAQRELVAALDEPFDPLSSADTLLIAVGELWRDPDVPTPLGLDDIEGYLAAFVDWVGDLATAGPAAVPVLSTVAEYGRRWEALAAVTLDPYRPSLIKMTEERRAALSRRPPAPVLASRGWRWRRVAGAVALAPVALLDLDPGSFGSYHVSIGTDDSSIEISHPVVLDLLGRPVERTYVEDVQHNREVYAYYTTDVRRPSRAQLAVGLSISPDVSRVTVAILVLMALAVALAALPFELGPDAVAVIAVPSSFAATILLTRERSSLAAWVLGPAKVAMLALLVALAVLSGLRALGWHQSGDSAPAPSPASARNAPDHDRPR